jgi:hypothetical protein
MSMTDKTDCRPEPDSSSDESQVWLCVLVTVDGIETWACRTERLALGELANACRGYWEGARHVERRLDRDLDLALLPAVPADDDRAAVEAYFEVMGRRCRPSPS